MHRTSSLAALALAFVALACFSARAYAVSLQFTAVPFTASGSPDSGDLNANVVSDQGTSFAILSNPNRSTLSSYAGVLITPSHARVVTGFQNVSFLLKGSSTTQVTVHSAPPGHGSFNYSWVPSSKGMDSDQSASDGYQKVSIDARQLGLSAGSRIDRLVITSDPYSQQPSFLVKDLRVNGAQVETSISSGTKFFKVASNSATGPLGPAHIVKSASNVTTVSFKNRTGSTVTCFITLTPAPAEPSASISNINQISSSVSITGYDSNPLHGTFTLGSEATATFAPMSGGPQLFSANMYVGDQSECTPPYGETFAEFTLNVDGNPLTEETVDISEVNGVNALYDIDLTPTSVYACEWSNSDYLQQNGQYIQIKRIQNTPGAAPNFEGDINSIGVYPFGCTNCVNRAGAPVCLTYPSGDTGCDTNDGQHNLCQANRVYQTTAPPPSQSCLGGVVAITLLQFPYSGASGSGKKGGPSQAPYGRHRGP